MRTYRAIITKRDTRAYQDRPVDEDTLRKILTAGRMAGSSKNGQPCRFVVMRDRESIKALAGCGQFTTPMLGAPLVVAILLEPEGRPFDAGRAGQNMMLAAWEEGVTSCPVAVQDAECGRKTLGAPEGWHVAMVITMGYPTPGSPMSRGAKRLSLDELVHWEKW